MFCQESFDNDDEEEEEEEDDTPKDSFSSLGIPAFKLDIPVKKKKERIQLNSIEDLPRFIESGQFSNQAGMKLITKFLSEDDEDLKGMGGVYDQTGSDGLLDEEEEDDGTERRNQQRARSAALLYQQTLHENAGYAPYGESLDKEKVENWLTYQVLLMDPKGNHKLIKVCIPDLKFIDSVIVFGMGDQEQCAPRIQTAYDLAEKGKAYYKKAGFEKFAPAYAKDKENAPDIKLPPFGDPAITLRMKEKNSEQKTDDQKTETKADDKKMDDKKADDKKSDGDEKKNDDADLSEEDKEMKELQAKMAEIAEKKKIKEEKAKKAKEEAEKKAMNEVLKNQTDKPAEKAHESKPADEKESENNELKDEVKMLKEELEALKKAVVPQAQEQTKTTESARFKEDSRNLRDVYAERDRLSQGIYNQIHKKIRF